MKTIFYSTEIHSVFERVRKTVTEKPGLYIIKLTKANKKRSLSQNAYYWGVVVKIIADHTGYTSHEVHQVLADEFLRYFSTEAGRQFTRSTTDLDTLDFEKYLENCRRWATNMDLRIPLPNEVTEDMYDQLESL